MNSNICIGLHTIQLNFDIAERKILPFVNIFDSERKKTYHYYNSHLRKKKKKKKKIVTIFEKWKDRFSLQMHVFKMIATLKMTWNLRQHFRFMIKRKYAWITRERRFDGTHIFFSSSFLPKTAKRNDIQAKIDQNF